MNAIRLRVWVNPNSASSGGANGWCDISDMVTKAVLADNEGMDILITIHFSDWWADPGKQNKPTAWESMSVTQLNTAVYNHTTDVVTALGNAGVTPKWVQIGNETNDGMLWQDGRASQSGMANYAQFVTSGHHAVKDYNSNIKTVAHIANGNDNALYQWNIGGIIGNGAQFDIIGMSLYPETNDWQTLNNDCYANMLDVKSRYSKDVMVVEVGMSQGSPATSKQFLEDIIDKTQQAGGLGVFYWEPQTHNGWKGYTKGAWDDDGSPSIALDAFIDTTLNVSQTKNHIQIYPNPVSNELVIKPNTLNIRFIKIVDITGKTITIFDDIQNKNTFNISHLQNGIYFLIINNNQYYRFLKN